MQPGHMLRLAKNAVTAQFIVDLNSVEVIITIAKELVEFIQNNIPIRFGVVPLVGNDLNTEGRLKKVNG
jgi:hypothetical protein